MNCDQGGTAGWPAGVVIRRRTRGQKIKRLRVAIDPQHAWRDIGDASRQTELGQRPTMRHRRCLFVLVGILFAHGWNHAPEGKPLRRSTQFRQQLQSLTACHSNGTGKVVICLSLQWLNPERFFYFPIRLIVPVVLWPGLNSAKTTLPP